ncbi:MAG: PQQ-dependent sugar dehydrogenase [Solirubrobacterales bacterium]|nr:PQQ-dependent sugar dehydrogenase [Solirubrobacterales bacterium]
MRNRLIGVIAVCCALAACGGDDDQAESSNPAPTREAAPSPTATVTPSESGPARVQGDPRVTTVATGLEAPWEMAFLPDGRALVTERPGRVRLLSSSGELRTEPVATVEVQALGEGGLLGLAVDPDFRSNRLVYLYRTVASGNEVARYEMTDGGLEERAVIARGIRAAGIHNGGRLRFGPDERLYFSAGDAAEEGSAQDPKGLNGKILRLSSDEYRRGSDARPEIFSLGHRNPQGFDWQPGTDRLVENEHGPDGDDEVNLLRAGGNYGWPEIRGEEQREGLLTPVAVYPQSIAPSGSTFVRRGGSAWTGDYLMAGLVGQRIQRVTISRAGRVTGNQALFEGDYGRLRSIVEGPDGALYALTNNTDGRGSPQEGDDRILRIVPPAA